VEDCERCSDLEATIHWLEGKIKDLESTLSKEREKTDDYNSIKSERDEMQKAKDRDYDNWALTPEGMP